MSGLCEDCKHWNPDADRLWLAAAAWGYCEKAAGRGFSGGSSQSLAFAIHDKYDQNSGGQLLTRRTFGCVQFEENQP